MTIAYFYRSLHGRSLWLFTILGLVLGGAMLAGSAFSWAGGRIGERAPLTASVGLATLAAIAETVYARVQEKVYDSLVNREGAL